MCWASAHRNRIRLRMKRARYTIGETGDNFIMSAVQPLIPSKKIAAFCKRWEVVEFALFGSAVREDFSPQSDIDVLVSFAPQSDWGLFEHIQMKQELKELFGREVDLVTRRALEQSRNALLRSEILSTMKLLYPEHESARCLSIGMTLF
jgi:predicted nucleotidyltransferase